MYNYISWFITYYHHVHLVFLKHGLKKMAPLYIAHRLPSSPSNPAPPGSRVVGGGDIVGVLRTGGAGVVQPEDVRVLTPSWGYWDSGISWNLILFNEV